MIKLFISNCFQEKIDQYYHARRCLKLIRVMNADDTPDGHQQYAYLIHDFRDSENADHLLEKKFKLERRLIDKGAVVL